MKTIIPILLAIVMSGHVSAQGWVPVGVAGFSDSVVGSPSMAIDKHGTVYVAFAEGYSHKATVMKFNGSSWVAVGSKQFSNAGAFYTSLAIDTAGTPYIAFSDGANAGKATVMQYNGTAWTLVGTAGFSATNAASTVLAIDRSGTPYVAFSTQCCATGTGSVMKYTAGAWVMVGSSFSTNVQFGVSMALDTAGVPYVAFEDGIDGAAEVMKYGSGWSVVGGTGFTMGAAYDVSIAINPISNTPYIAYSDNSSGTSYSGGTTVRKLSGSSWLVLGSAGFTPGLAPEGIITFSATGIPYVLYADGNSSYEITVASYPSSGWGNVGAPDFTASSSFPPHGTRIADVAIAADGTAYMVYTDPANAGRATARKYGYSSAVDEVAMSPASVHIFPNPATGAFIVNIAAAQLQQVTITITNTLGRKVKELSVVTGKNTAVQSADLASGVYYVSAILADGSSVGGKLIVE